MEFFIPFIEMCAPVFWIGGGVGWYAQLSVGKGCRIGHAFDEFTLHQTLLSCGDKRTVIIS